MKSRRGAYTGMLIRSAHLLGCLASADEYTHASVQARTLFFLEKVSCWIMSGHMNCENHAFSNRKADIYRLSLSNSQGFISHYYYYKLM